MRATPPKLSTGMALSTSVWFGRHFEMDTDPGSTSSIPVKHASS